MPTISQLVPFLAVSLGFALTPGPNMAHLTARAMTQGRRAALTALSGISAGFVIHMLGAAFGLTALVLAIPYAYDTLRVGGAVYLLHLAWRMARPARRPSCAVDASTSESPRRVFVSGLLNNLINPKIAIIYLSLLPQFIDPSRGYVFAQTLILGAVYTSVSISVNGMVAVAAGSMGGVVAGRPGWRVAQRLLTSALLAALAVRMLVTIH